MMVVEIACASCGQSNSPDQRFCGRCGVSLLRPCPSCGAENPAGFAFCGTGLEQLKHGYPVYLLLINGVLLGSASAGQV